MRAAGVGKDFKENPNLRDNWTDAEGYYRESCILNPFIISQTDVTWTVSLSVETLVTYCLKSWKCTITT